MFKVKWILAGIFLVSFFAAFSNAQTSAEMKESGKFERQATEDYKAKNYAQFLANIKRAADLRPNHALLLYNLAAASALNNKTDAALTILERLGAMNLFFAIEKDEDFKSLLNQPRFKKIQARFADNQKAVGKDEKAFTIPQKNLNIEGIAYDAAAKRFFVSSITHQKIMIVDAVGKVSDFSSETDGLWSVFGMRVDEQRKILWATTNALPQIQTFHKSGIFKYDLETGKLLKKYILPDEARHVLGDLTIAKNGDVFASDSFSPNIYRIETKKDELELFLTSDLFNSLQGLNFSADEIFLFVADYSKGVFRITMKDKKIVQIAADANTNLLGIDGLYFYQGDLIAIQNNFQPHRVARFFLNKGFSRITKSATLEANHADFKEPTLGVRSDENFYYIANSQGASANQINKSSAEKLKEPTVLRLKL